MPGKHSDSMIYFLPQPGHAFPQHHVSAAWCTTVPGSTETPLPSVLWSIATSGSLGINYWNITESRCGHLVLIIIQLPLALHEALLPSIVSFMLTSVQICIAIINLTLIYYSVFLSLAHYVVCRAPDLHQSLNTSLDHANVCCFQFTQTIVALCWTLHIRFICMDYVWKCFK